MVEHEGVAASSSRRANKSTTFLGLLKSVCCARRWSVVSYPIIMYHKSKSEGSNASCSSADILHTAVGQDSSGHTHFVYAISQSNMMLGSSTTLTTGSFE